MGTHCPDPFSVCFRILFEGRQRRGESETIAKATRQSGGYFKSLSLLIPACLKQIGQQGFPQVIRICFIPGGAFISPRLV